MPPAVVLQWAWSIAKLVVDGLLDKTKTPEEVMAGAALEIAAFKLAQAEEDKLSQEKYPRYRP